MYSGLNWLYVIRAGIRWRSLPAAAALLAAAPTVIAAPNPALVATVISGSRVYSPERLFPVYKDQLGVEIDAQSIRAILANIESFYLRDGFYKPELVARPEISGSGILLIEVYEARLSAVQISGNSGPHAARLRQLADALQARAPLPSGAIEAAVRQMRALPGLSIRASTVRDADVRNGLILQLAVSYQPVAATATWSNRGTSQIGPNFVSAQVTANSLLGGREQIGLVATSAFQYQEYHGIGGSVATPLNDHGTEVLLSGYHSDAVPDTGDAQLDLKYPHDLANIRLVQRLGDHPYGSLAVFAGFDFDDSRIQYDGQQLESDRVRMALVGATLDGTFHDSAAYSVASSLRRGVSGLDAGVTTLDGLAVPDNYTIGTLDSVLVVQLSGPWSANVRASGQWSGNLLPYEERFKIGTQALGRAFTTAVLAGDSGVGLQGQLHYGLPGLVPAWAGSPSLFAYTDYGTVWEHDLSVQQYAVTSGAGLSLQVPRVTGSVEVGKPVGFSAGLPHDFTVMGQVTVSF